MRSSTLVILVAIFLVVGFFSVANQNKKEDPAAVRNVLSVQSISQLDEHLPAISTSTISYLSQ